MSYAFLFSLKDFFSGIHKKAPCKNFSPAKSLVCVQALIGLILPSLSHSTGEPAPGVQSEDSEVS